MTVPAANAQQSEHGHPAHGSGFCSRHITALPVLAQQGCGPPAQSSSGAGCRSGGCTRPLPPMGAAQCRRRMRFRQHMGIMSSATGQLHKNEPLAMPVPRVKGLFRPGHDGSSREKRVGHAQHRPSRPDHPDARWGCAVTVQAVPERPGIVFFSFLISFFRMTTL